MSGSRARRVLAVVAAALLGAVALLGASRPTVEAGDTAAPTAVAERHAEVVPAAGTAPVVRAVRVTAGPTAIAAIAALVLLAGPAARRCTGGRDGRAWWLLVRGCWRVAVPWSGSPLAARRGPPAAPAPAVAPAIA